MNRNFIPTQYFNWSRLVNSATRAQARQSESGGFPSVAVGRREAVNLRRQTEGTNKPQSAVILAAARALKSSKRSVFADFRSERRFFSKEKGRLSV